MAGQIPDELYGEIKDAFYLFDKKADGIISVQYLEAIIKTLGLSPTEAELIDMEQKLDKEGNGLMKFEDFLELIAPQIRTSYKDEELVEAFRVFDKNGTGFITSEELKEVMINLGEPATDEDVENMIRESDLDGDGKISFEEFTALMNIG